MKPKHLGSMLAGAVLATAADAQVLFSENFESPVVSGYDANSAPASNWIGSANDYRADFRGLFNEVVAWPDVPVFATPFGDQAFLIDYSTAGLTTSQNAIPGVLSTGITYTITFQAGVRRGESGTYRVELVAFSSAESNATRSNCSGTRPGAILTNVTGAVATNDLSVRRTFTYTPTGTNTNLGKEIGLRLMTGGGSILYDALRVTIGNDPAPQPADWTTVPAGAVSLRWSNLSPSVGTNTYVDVWYGTNTTAWTQIVVGGLNVTSATVNAPVAATYFWRIDSYLNGSSNGPVTTGAVFRFFVTDTDGDGLPDAYELAHTTPASGTALNPDDDSDSDTLSNAQEYQYGTDPNDADTDNDALSDGPELVGVGLRPPTSPLLSDTDGDGFTDAQENNSGVWGGSGSPGTNPAKADTDGDGLQDAVENNTGVFVSKSVTGTSPLATDSDGDGEGDWYEVRAVFTDPNNPAAKGSLPYPLPKPDLTPTATNKRVKVFILSGQSNMVGMGDHEPTNAPGSLHRVVKTENKFSHVLDTNGNWAARNDVRYRGVISAFGNTNLTVGQGASSTSIGPELGFGHVMGYHFDEPVLLIKASIGNRSIGWDYLPPGSLTFTNGATVYAGYGDLYQSWPVGSPPTNAPGWYAGKQYDECFLNEADWSPSAAILGAAPVTNVVDVLDNFAAQYPQWAAQDFEIAGFVWFQGNKDIGSGAPYTTRYETNLVQLIKQLRQYYQNRYPTHIQTDAPFVIATGCGDPQTNGAGLVVADGQLAMNNTNKYPEFAGNVKTMDIRPYWREVNESPDNQGYHYNRNAETYLLVGDALGRGMLDLLAEAGPDTNGPTVATLNPADGTTNVAVTANLVAVFNEAIQPGAGNITIKNLTDATQTTISITDGAQITATGVVFTINPVLDLIPGKDYAVQIDPTALLDMATNAFAGITNDTTWNFSTKPLDITPPVISTVTPVDGASNVALNADLVVTFNEPVLPGTGDITLKNLTDATQTTIAITDGSQISVTGAVLTINPSANLGSGKAYAVQIASAALVDLATNGFAGIADDTTWNFTTVPPDTTPPAVTVLSPADGATNVSPVANLVVTFNEPIAAGSGSITLKNLTDATQTAIAITDAVQVSIAGAVLTINPTGTFAVAKDYAVQLDAGALTDIATNGFAGISDDTTWNFSSAPYALGALRYWEGGATNLSGSGNGASAGGPGVWDLATTNWDAGNGLPYAAWANENNDVAVLGGSAGTVTVAQAITVGGLSFTANGTMVTNSVLTFGAPGSISNATGVTTMLASSLAGGWPITKSGAGTVILTASNTISGGLDIAAGTVQVSNGSHSNALGSPANAITFTGNSTLYNANGTFNMPQGLTANTGVVATLRGAFGEMLIVNGPVAGSGTLRVDADSNGWDVRWNSTSNTFSGTVQIYGNAGSDVLRVNSLVDSASPIQLGRPASANTVGVFEYAGGAVVPLVLSNRQVQLVSTTSGGTLQNNNTASAHANTVTVLTDLGILGVGNKVFNLGGANTNANVFAGAITNGVGSLISVSKSDAGTWVLTGSNTYGGVTSITGGVLVISSIGNVNGGPSALGTPANTTNGTISIGSFGGGGTLRYIGSGDASDRIINLSGTTGGAVLEQSGSGPWKFISDFTASGAGAKTLTLRGATTATGELAGAVVDNSAANTTSVFKAGTGTWILSGTNAYRGLTTITGGTLIVHGSLLTNGIVLVRPLGTLSGTGSVGHVVNSGQVAPGSDVPGTLYVSGTYTQSAGLLSIRIGAGVHDRLAVGNGATLGGTVKVTLVSTPAVGSSFNIVTASGLTGGFAVTNLPPLPAGSGWTVANVATAIVLSVTGAPPATGYAAFSNANALVGGPEGDDDGDGFANLLEYVTGSSPTNGASNASMSAARTNSAFALRFLRATNTVDATLIVEGAYVASSDAEWIGFATNNNGSWGGATNVVEAVGSPATVTVYDVVPAATNRFLRLRVTRP